MADVADIVSTQSEGSQKFERGHHDHKGAHAHLDGNGKHDDLAIRKQDGAGQENTEDRTGRSDGRNIGTWLAPEKHVFHDDVDKPCANPGEKVILKKSIAAPGELQFATKHKQHKHVGENVPDGGSIMQK